MNPEVISIQNFGQQQEVIPSEKSGELPRLPGLVEVAESGVRRRALGGCAEWLCIHEILNGLSYAGLSEFAGRALRVMAGRLVLAEQIAVRAFAGDC